jgi:hypothetical protein
MVAEIREDYPHAVFDGMRLTPRGGMTEPVEARKQRRQIDLDPIVLVLLALGVWTGARAVRGFDDGGSEHDRLNLATALSVLALAWLRPVVLRRRLLGGDPQVDDLVAVDRDLDYGDRVAVWLVVVLAAAAVLALLDDDDLLLGSSITIALVVFALLARVFVARRQRNPVNKQFEVEGYLTPVLVVARPTRLVLMLLGSWSVLAGLGNRVPHDGRVALLAFGALLITGAFVDGLVTRRGDSGRTEHSEVVSVRLDLTALEARLRDLESAALEPDLKSQTEVRRPLFLVLVVNVAALAASGVALHSALFDAGQEPAQDRLLLFSGLALLLAFVGDRIRSLTLNKDGLTLSDSTERTSDQGARVAGDPAATLGHEAHVGPDAERRLQLGNFEPLPNLTDLESTDAVILSPKGLDANQTAALILTGTGRAYRPAAQKSTPLPVRSMRTLQIVGRPRAVHKEIVDSFYRRN